MSITTSYLNKLPVMPMWNLPLVNDIELVQCIRTAYLGNKTLSLATGECTNPEAVIKHTADGNSEYKGGKTSSECRRSYDAFKLLHDKWPDRYEKYIGQFLWLNGQGDTIAPVWEGRANILGYPEWMLIGLLSIWANQPPEMMRGVIWLDSGPKTFMARHLPLMVLATLPDLLYWEVVETFDVLGQGFMKYLIYHAKKDNLQVPNGRADSFVELATNLAKFSGRIGVYGTSAVLRVLYENSKTEVADA